MTEWISGTEAITSIASEETTMQYMVLNPNPIPIAMTATTIRMTLMAK